MPNSEVKIVGGSEQRIAAFLRGKGFEASPAELEELWALFEDARAERTQAQFIANEHDLRAVALHPSDIDIYGDIRRNKNRRELVVLTGSSVERLIPDAEHYASEVLHGPVVILDANDTVLKVIDEVRSPDEDRYTIYNTTGPGYRRDGATLKEVADECYRTHSYFSLLRPAYGEFTQYLTHQRESSVGLGEMLFIVDIKNGNSVVHREII